MLRYATLCYATLCYAMLCHAMLCHAMLRYAMLPTPSYPTPSPYDLTSPHPTPHANSFPQSLILDDMMGGFIFKLFEVRGLWGVGWAGRLK